VFAVQTARYIRTVEVQGTNTVYRSDVEKRLFLRSGTPFNPGRKESRERLDRQTAAIQSHLRQQGLEDARVEARAVLVDPDLVDITIEVSEGRPARIDRVSIDISQPEQNSENPEFSCPEVTRKQLRDVMGVPTGDLYKATTGRLVKKRLRSFLQQYGFLYPRIHVDFDREERRLTATVKLTRCFSIHILEREEADAYGQGYTRITDGSYYQALPFRESGSFDRREAERGLQELITFYRLRGYLFADIEMQFTDYRTMQSDWPFPLLGGVTYRVTRNQPSEIREIAFEGVHAFTPDGLLTTMQTRRYDFFDVGGFLDVDRLFADLDMIRQEYFDLGYFRMRYPDASRDGGGALRIQYNRKRDVSLYRYVYADKAFDVVKPDWENAIRIVIRVDEGPGSTVGSVAVNGVSALSEDQLRAALPMTSGSPFSPKLAKFAALTLDDKLRRLGYRPTITTRCVGHDPDVGPEDCRVESVRSATVDIVLDVVEGPRFRMGEVLVAGNLKTAWSVVAGEFPSQGETFDSARVDEALRRLRNLGVFTTVKTVLIGEDEDPPRPRLAVMVQVEESRSRFLEFSAGFQTMLQRAGSEGQEQEMDPFFENVLSNSIHNTGASLSGAASFQTIRFPDVLLLLGFTYTNANLLGYAKTFEWPVSYGLSTTDPARYAAFRPTYIDRRLFGSELMLRLTPLIVYDKAMDVLDKFEYGLESEISRPFAQGVYLGLLSKVSRIAWKFPNEAEFRPLEFQFETSPVVRFDWRDNPINPTSGTMAWGRLSYINALSRDPDGAGTRDNFWKFEVGTQLYLSLRQVLVLGTNLRYGDSVSSGGANLPEYQRYRLGGTNGVRGFLAGKVYQYNIDGSPRLETVTKIDENGEKYPADVPIEGGDTVLAGSIELRFPILRSSGLWGAAFLDGGGLSDGLGEMNGSSFRFSTGAGIRWLIGGTIPLRLDYGFVLDRRCGTVDDKSGDCLAMEDPGAIDFGLLYTF
jgi:outer membrane protein assembly factor BamA